MERDSYILLPKGKGGNVEKEIFLPEFVESPIEEGEELGYLLIKIDGKEMDKIKLISNTSINKAGLKEMFKKNN